MSDPSIWNSLTQFHVVMWVAIAVVTVGPCAALAWWAVRSREAELRTIEMLAERGYTADEIKQLVRRSRIDDFSS